MKTNFLKIILLTISFSALAIDLPQIQKPLELESGEFAEGTITTLSKEDIKEYLPWANNAKKNLEDALSESKRLPLRERISFLENEIKTVVRASNPKKYQQLMRFALNRGLLMVDILDKEADSKEIGVIQNQLDLLIRSIKISFEFYESDLAFQKRATEDNNAINIPQAELGIKLAKSFLESSDGVFDASAQYQFMKKTFEILNWDLTQDKNAKDYSEIIVDIYKVTSRLPVQVSSDEEAIKHIRSLYYLNKKINLTLKMVQDKIQEEKNRIATLEREESARIERINQEKLRQEEELRIINEEIEAVAEMWKKSKNGKFVSLGKGLKYKDAVRNCKRFDGYLPSQLEVIAYKLNVAWTDLIHIDNDKVWIKGGNPDFGGFHFMTDTYIETICFKNGLETFWELAQDGRYAIIGKGLSYQRAQAYCESKNGRVPTKDEAIINNFEHTWTDVVRNGNVWVKGGNPAYEGYHFMSDTYLNTVCVKK